MPKLHPVVESVYLKLGGRSVLGEDVASDADLARLVNRRIPLRVLTCIKRIGFSDQEIWRYIIPARTQRHRKARKERLTVAESDRLVRLTRIQALAEDVLGDAWLDQAREAILVVPSVIMPIAGVLDRNALINHRHSAADRITIVGITSFTFDPRLFRP